MINETYKSVSHINLHALQSNLILDVNKVVERGLASTVRVSQISDNGNLIPDSSARLHLIGPLRLFNAEGIECTPSGGVRKALLAILILSNDGRKGRATIQDLLWEKSQPAQGAGSLRASLSTLRKELRVGLGYDPISTDNQAIEIDTKSFWVDVNSIQEIVEGAQNPILGHYELLEGLNVRNCGGNNFEEWLRVERVYWKNQIEKYIHPIKDDRQELVPLTSDKTALRLYPVTSPISSTSHVGIGVLPVELVQGGAFGQMLGDTVLDAIGSDVEILGRFSILDYRECSDLQKSSIDSFGPIAFIGIKVLVENGRISIRLKINTSVRNELILSDYITLDYVEELSVESLSLTMFISRNVDRLLNWAAKASSNLLLPHTPYHTLTGMFKYQNDELDSLQLMLENNSDKENYSSGRALLAYLQTFRIGEHWRNYNEYEIKQYTNELVQSVLEEPTHDPIAMTSVGHVLGYILHDYSSGIDYLKRAVRLNPTQAFSWDHLALHQMYIGKYDDAYVSAKNAVNVGAYSPLRFTYDTTVCMVCTLKGDFEEAAKYGARALLARPQFGAALRYMAVSQAHLGNLSEARDLVARIHEMDPEFSLKWISEDRFALIDEGAKQLIREGLMKAGLH